MGSGSVDDDTTIGSVKRPSLSLSRCPPNKPNKNNKLRTDRKAKKATKPNSDSTSKIKSSCSKRHRSSSKKRVLPSKTRERENYIKGLEKSTSDGLDPPPKKKATTTAPVNRGPPIPSFSYCGSEDDDDDGLPIPLFTAVQKAKSMPKSIQPPMLSNKTSASPTTTDINLSPSNSNTVKSNADKGSKPAQPSMTNGKTSTLPPIANINPPPPSNEDTVNGSKPAQPLLINCKISALPPKANVNPPPSNEDTENGSKPSQPPMLGTKASGLPTKPDTNSAPKKLDTYNDSKSSPAVVSESTKSLQNEPQSVTPDVPLIPPSAEPNQAARSAPATNRGKSQHKSQPSQESLILAVDDIFQKSDHSTMTKRMVIQALEKMFQLSLTPQTCKMVKKRLNNLVNGRVMPTAREDKRTKSKRSKPAPSDQVPSLDQRPSGLPLDPAKVSSESTQCMVQSATGSNNQQPMLDTIQIPMGEKHTPVSNQTAMKGTEQPRREHPTNEELPKGESVNLHHPPGTSSVPIQQAAARKPSRESRLPQHQTNLLVEPTSHANPSATSGNLKPNQYQYPYNYPHHYSYQYAASGWGYPTYYNGYYNGYGPQQQARQFPPVLHPQHQVSKAPTAPIRQPVAQTMPSRASETLQHPPGDNTDMVAPAKPSSIPGRRDAATPAALSKEGSGKKGIDVKSDSNIAKNVIGSLSGNSACVPLPLKAQEGPPKEKQERVEAAHDKKKLEAGSRATSIINLDSDSDESIGFSAMPASKKKNSPSLDKENAAGGKRKVSKVSKQGGKASQAKSANSNKSKKMAQKVTRKRSRECSRCKGCSCKNPTKESAFSLLQSSYNEGDREKHLLKERKKHEQAAEKAASDLANVDRELKKIRRSMTRKTGEEQKGEARFLADGKEMDDQMTSMQTFPLGTKQVTEARSRLFGVATREQSSQPTLTQMFGCSKRNKVPEAKCNSNTDEGCGDGGKLMDPVIHTNTDDDMEDGASVASSFEVFSSSDKEESAENDIVFRRTSWRNGSVLSAPTDPNSDLTMWNALLNIGVQQQRERSHYDCAFNRLFSKGSESGSDVGIDHLLGLFDEQVSPETSPAKSAPRGTPPPSNSSPLVAMSVLTQRGKSLAEGIHEQVASDKARLADLEAVCPQWRENVAYAMNQRDARDLKDATKEIQESRQRLEMMKDSFLRAWQQQQGALDIYELALNQSLQRLETPVLSATPSEMVADHVPSPTTSVCVVKETSNSHPRAPSSRLLQP